MRGALHWLSGGISLAILGVSIAVALVADENWANRDTLTSAGLGLLLVVAVFAGTSDPAAEWWTASRGRAFGERDRVRDLRSAVLAVESELSTYQTRLAAIIQAGTFAAGDRETQFRGFQWQGRRDMIGRDERAEDAYQAAAAAYRLLPTINRAIRGRVPPPGWRPLAAREIDMGVRADDNLGEALAAIEHALEHLRNLRKSL